MLGLFTGVLTVAVAYDDIPGVAVLKAEADACATSTKQAANGMMQMLSAAPTEHSQGLEPPKQRTEDGHLQPNDVRNGADVGGEQQQQQGHVGVRRPDVHVDDGGEVPQYGHHIGEG